MRSGLVQVGAAVAMIAASACTPAPGSLGNDAPSDLAQGFDGGGGPIDDDDFGPGLGDDPPDLGVADGECAGGEFVWDTIHATDDLFLLAQVDLGTCIVDHQGVDFFGTPHVPCHDINTGSLPRLWIAASEARESHYLARFDFSELDPAFVDRATLVVHGTHQGPVELLVHELAEPYADWEAGTGQGTLADPGEASFNWYRYPDIRWSDEEKDAHIAGVVLDESIEWDDDEFSVELDPDWILEQTELGHAHPGLVFTALGAEPFALRWQAAESGQGPFIRVRYCKIDIAAP